MEAEKIRRALNAARNCRAYQGIGAGVWASLPKETLDEIIAAASAHADYLQPLVHGSDAGAANVIDGEKLHVEAARRIVADLGDIHLMGLLSREADALIVARAFLAHVSTLTEPVCKTKTVSVWRVEFAHQDGSPGCEQWQSAERARYWADSIRRDGCSCVRVTGPHSQTVPA
jgi:hypothetical protein